MKLPQKGKASWHLLMAIAKNPDVSLISLRHIYGYGDFRRALRKMPQFVTLIDGKYILDLDAKDALLADTEVVVENKVPPRQVNVYAGGEYVMPAIQSSRIGALDYKNIQSLHGSV